MSETAGLASFRPAPVKPAVNSAAVEALDIRVGTITEIHDVEASTKLLRLVVSFGDHQRNILAGLKAER
ncbi:MAG: hypothetical protein U0002_21780, partial [Thermoanaerobaculia bacterium]